MIPVYTVTVTATVAATTTVPGATVTVSTTLVSTSDVFTTLSTQTLLTATPTATATGGPYYAECAPNNILGPTNGGLYIQGFTPYIPHTIYFPTGNFTSAYDCCVACFSATNNCAGGIFNAATNSCSYSATNLLGTTLYSVPSCPADTTQNPSYFVRVSTVAQQYAFDGPCGIMAPGN